MLLKFKITKTLFGWSFYILSNRFPGTINFHGSTKDAQNY
jgi:hypothetical protein